MNASDPELARRYFDQGFVHPIDLMTDIEVEGHYARLLGYERHNGPLHYRVKPYLVFSSAYEIATHPNLLDAVEQVLGPDILLWDASFIVKEPDSKGFISWHQDMTYWGLEADSDDDLVSAWVALTPAMQMNGCMQFVRGSHRGPRLEHKDTYDENNLLHRGQEIENQFDESLVTHLEMQPGQASLHHGWAVHSSNPNASHTRRVALAINYVRPNVRQTVTDGESATLVRGEDRYGHFRHEPTCGEDNLPENVAFQLEVERLKREVYSNA
ncbi:MAG: phytanoyl-CoA dioxygenase family protein [Pseudomonadota bacterium]